MTLPYNAIQTVLAIDPGNRTGWALFHGGLLLAAGVTTTDGPLDVSRPDLVVLECPTRVYAQSTVGSILKLARCVGRYEERFSDTLIELVEPRAWKGTIDGDIMIARIRAAMSAEETATASSYKGGYAHNMVDAIGLGKWALRQPFMRQPRRARKAA